MPYIELSGLATTSNRLTFDGLANKDGRVSDELRREVSQCVCTRERERENEKGKERYIYA